MKKVIVLICVCLCFESIFGKSDTGKTNEWPANFFKTLKTKDNAEGISCTITTPDSSVHFIGEKYGGGIVFYVYDKGRYGLIAAVADQSTESQPWYNGAFKQTGATRDGIGEGAKNTSLIIAAQSADNKEGTFVAKLCADYSVTVNGITYDDWYLPSKAELNLLFLQKDVVSGLSYLYYWSSTEIDNNEAWMQNFTFDEQLNVSKDHKLFVRAIRAF